MHKLMDSIYSNKSSKTPKLRNPSGAVSPLMSKYFGLASNSSSSSSVDPFSPPSITSKYSGKSSNNSGSPLSAAAMANDEDVFVMDGILVSNNKSCFYKTEICRSWEDFGKCRFGSKCQFAHGKEEVRPTHFPVVKNKSEICKSHSTGSCLFGAKCRFVHQMMTDSALVLATQTDSPTKTDYAIKSPRSPLAFTNKTFISSTAYKFEQQSKMQNISIKTQQTSSFAKAVHAGGTSMASVTCKDYWSPQDDGINVALPSHSDSSFSRQDVDAYINRVLYQHSGRRRLPVFVEICPE